MHLLFVAGLVAVSADCLYETRLGFYVFGCVFRLNRETDHSEHDRGASFVAAFSCTPLNGILLLFNRPHTSLSRGTLASQPPSNVVPVASLISLVEMG